MIASVSKECRSFSEVENKSVASVRQRVENASGGVESASQQHAMRNTMAGVIGD